MQKYQFDYSSYNKRINPNKKVGFTLISITIIILMGLAFFLSNNTKKTSSYYFVEVGNFLKYSDANKLAIEIKSKGGAGYVYYKDTYHVFTSFYLNENDAQTVCDNLSSSYANSKVFSIEISSFSSFTKLSANENKALSNAYMANQTLIKELYTAINKYDTSTYNLQQLRVNLANVIDNYNKDTASIQAMFNNSKYLTSKKYILDIISCCEEIENSLNNKETNTLKYNSIKIVLLHNAYASSI